jgi:hypothetical protein
VVVLLILVLSCLIFRGLGSAGIPAFANWQASARHALSLMLVFTGISHFTFMKDDFVRICAKKIQLHSEDLRAAEELGLRIMRSL